MTIIESVNGYSVLERSGTEVVRIKTKPIEVWIVSEAEGDILCPDGRVIRPGECCWNSMEEYIRGNSICSWNDNADTNIRKGTVERDGK